MCHVCFKFFVDENSFLAHFRQEHMNYWKWSYFALMVTYMPVRQEASTAIFKFHDFNPVFAYVT